jgi:hypothetical protein
MIELTSVGIVVVLCLLTLGLLRLCSRLEHTEQ